MAKRKRVTPGNKISASNELIKVDPEPLVAPPDQVYVARATNVVRTTFFSAEFERVIEIIARERVYRAMMARSARPLLLTPPERPEMPPFALE